MAMKELRNEDYGDLKILVININPTKCIVCTSG